jgi:hypothetical protein
MRIVGITLAHTPVYVWAVLALLVVLGVRRLRPRQTHLAKAALAPAGFFIWSMATAALMFGRLDAWAVVACWGIPFAAGAASGRVRTVARPKHVSGWVFIYSASLQPLAFYMLLFAARYGLGIWAGFVPSAADVSALLGLSLSAFTAGRTLGDFIPPLITALTSIKQASGSDENEHAPANVRSSP